MNITNGNWVADIRVGCVAVHPENLDKYRCLDGIENSCIFYKHGFQVFKQNGDFDHWDVNPEDIANANLIAAAPNLLRELRDADITICELCKRLNPQHVSQDHGKGCNWCEDRASRLAVIARAEGK